jgi:hypothetical protein
MRTWQAVALALVHSQSHFHFQGLLFPLRFVLHPGSPAGNTFSAIRRPARASRSSFGRLVPTLVGELEDAPVNPDRAGGFEVLQDPHGLVGIGVLRAREQRGA